MTYGNIRTDWKRVFKRIGKIDTDLTLGSHIETVGEGTTSGGSGSTSLAFEEDGVEISTTVNRINISTGLDVDVDGAEATITSPVGEYNELGLYNSGTTYNIDDVVNYGGSSWIALQDAFTAQTPAEGAYWTLLAEKGEQGVSAFTNTSATFTQPTQGGSVTVTVGNTEWMGVGEVIFIVGGGYYQVSSITDTTHVVLVNQGYPENAAPTTSITSPKFVATAGARGTQGGQGDPGGVKYATLLKFGV